MNSTASHPQTEEDEEWMAALTVCDPLYGLSKEAAKEVLTAMGLKREDTHITVNWYGSRRKKD